MGIYQLEEEQFLPSSIEAVWDFISSPKNLKKITPDYMGFDIQTKNLAERMYPGMIICYKVRPVLRIPTTWVTEITQVVERQFFVDEQRVGPYALWHHQHHIEQRDGGVLMRDLVTYRPPLGVLGDIANSLFIRAKLREIFDYRRLALEKEFVQIKT